MCAFSLVKWRLCDALEASKRGSCSLPDVPNQSIPRPPLEFQKHATLNQLCKHAYPQEFPWMSLRSTNREWRFACRGGSYLVSEWSRWNFFCCFPLKPIRTIHIQTYIGNRQPDLLDQIRNLGVPDPLPHPAPALNTVHTAFHLLYKTLPSLFQSTTPLRSCDSMTLRPCVRWCSVLLLYPTFSRFLEGSLPKFIKELKLNMMVSVPSART